MNNQDKSSTQFIPNIIKEKNSDGNEIELYSADIRNYSFEEDDYDIQRWLKEWEAHRDDVDKPNQPFNGIISEKMWEHLSFMVMERVLLPEVNHRQQAISKWCTKGQGGTISLATSAHQLRDYAKPVNERELQIPEDFVTTVRNVLAGRHHIITYEYYNNHVIVENSIELYHTWSGRNAATGWSDPRKKKCDGVLSKCLSDARRYPYSYRPIKKGARFKDGKYRGIYCDDFSNYFREARLLSRIFSFIEEFPGDIHYSDEELSERIQDHYAKSSLACDCRGMDWHLRKKTFHEVMRMFGWIMSIPTKEIDYILWAIDPLWEVEVLVGDKVYVSDWSLLSGIYPTHNIEGILNLFVNLYVATKLGFTMGSYSSRLKSNEFVVYVCGDDSGLLLGRTLSEAEQSKAMNLYISVWGAFGEVTAKEKCDYNEKYLHICKKTIPLSRSERGFKQYATDHGQYAYYIYDLYKALYSLRYPENIPNFSDKRMLILWFCSIMDNAYGASQWASALNYIVQNAEIFSNVGDIDSTLVEEFITESNDWWSQQFGSNFRLESSRTYRWIIDHKK